MKLSAICVILLTTVALAQVPSAILLDSNSYPNLGAQITWSAVSGATYSVYGKVYQYKQDCTQINWLNPQLDVDLPGTTYDHFLTNQEVDQTGWGGYWCYGVSATVNGVEGAINPVHWPVAMGMKWYVNLFYMTPDCNTKLGGVNPPQFGVQVTRNRGSASEVMPQVEGSNPYRYAGFMRMLSSDTVDIQITLPDGKVLDFPHSFAIGGSPIVDDDAPYLYVEVNSDGSDSLCSVQTWNYLQKGMNNR